MRKIIFIVPFLLLLNGCADLHKRIVYDRDNSDFQSSKSCEKVYVDTVKDLRSDDLYTYGTVLGGFANPLKKLHSDIPLSDNIRELLETGLKKRGCYGNKEDANFVMSANLTKLHSDVLMQREVEITMGIQVLNKKLNEQIDWTDEIKSLVSNGMATGVMVDMDEYQKHVQNVFNNFVDQIIDNSKLKTFTTKRSINGSTDIDRRLAIAKDLYEKGSITKEEYESKRKEILGGL
jgi:hypothetical protein